MPPNDLHFCKGQAAKTHLAGARRRAYETRPRRNAMRDIQHFIGGAAVAGTSGRFGDVFNPNTGEVQARVALATTAELDAAVASAVRAQQVWALVNPQRRARVMFEFKRLIERDMNELAELLSSEHGKVI